MLSSTVFYLLAVFRKNQPFLIGVPDYTQFILNSPERDCYLDNISFFQLQQPTSIKFNLDKGVGF
jgi:hypothetical protein